MKILIVSSAIGPKQVIGAIRWTKIAKYLHKNWGAEIVALTNQKNYGNPKSSLPMVKKDSLLLKDMPAISEVWEAKAGWCTFLYWKIRKAKRTLFRQRHAPSSMPRLGSHHGASSASSRNGVKSKLGNICTFFTTAFLDQATYRDAAKEIRKKALDFDVVISSFSPVWPYLMAEEIKKEYPGIVWIADFRDTCAREGEVSFIYKWQKKHARKHCSSADVIVRVNDEMPVFSAGGQRIVTIHNGYDAEEALAPLPPPDFGLTYTGTIYIGKQSLRPVFRAVRELLDEGAIAKEDISFHYAGEEGDIFRGQASEFGLEDYVRDYGILPRRKALKLQQRSAVLLQAAWNTKIDRVEWTGKTYEYMMSRKPIVYVISGDLPHSLASKFTPKLGGVCYEESRSQETYPLLKKYIATQYSQWKETGDVAVCRDEEYVSQFEYSKIADKVWNLIMEEIGGAG